MKVNKYVYNCDRCGKDVGYPKVTYTTTITGDLKEGTSISTDRNTNDVTVCCCDSERRI